MIRLKTQSKGIFKAFDDDEFIGYVVMEASDKWLYNPAPDITLKSVTFDSWTNLHEYLRYRNY